MKLFSSFEADLYDFINLFGIFGQYRNDYRNLFMEEHENTKEVFADDLTEGKFTFPLIHAVQTLRNEEVLKLSNKNRKMWKPREDA
jgi:geranylgeranyl diphosphate synthase, type III